MAKTKTNEKDDHLLEVVVTADEVVFQDQSYKAGDKFKMDVRDPVSEGLLMAGAVMGKKDFDEREAAQKKVDERTAKEAAEREDSDDSDR